ncbi:HAMP domain-containing protein [Altererythrobacter indicus]|uniref:histidine kinase n=1 Tax=Altericroceibacterium indicum TaxID=374177 RepID=A0A845ACX1_9SPHN|nr:HAMP domain-containing sensor histidine kinase [Altericroceibacterium indicum]MXP27093.1 HAMP domain-containing protein [Altericroceibacterium indicum]
MQQGRWKWFGTHRLTGLGLAGLALLLLVSVAAVQFLASILFYDAIDRQTIRGDHARRVAELLVVSDRLYQRDPSATAQTMTTRHLETHISTQPAITRSGSNHDVTEIARQIVEWEPSLGGRELFLDAAHKQGGGRDLVGSMQLAHGQWLNFRSPDISSGWPVAFRATMMTLLISLLSIVIAMLALQRLTRPLRQLSAAMDAFEHGQALRIEEDGPADLRELARSFNSMQARISGLESDQAKSWEAISHDLRTPLSRLQMASGFVEENDIARIVSSSAGEMEALLNSLQSFLRAQHLASEAEELDLAELIRTLPAFDHASVHLEAPDDTHVKSYRDPLALALNPLIENALQYGDSAEIHLLKGENGWEITISDHGPGLPEDCFTKVLDPFFRVDEARARNTPGFGLGIPTAHRLLERFGGSLHFANQAGGGLVVRVKVPLAE